VSAAATGRAEPRRGELCEHVGSASQRLPQPGRWKRAYRYAVSAGVPRRSLVVAAAVGTVLNLINQGDRMVSGQGVDLTKLALTYIVPYFVSTYGAVSFRFRSERDHPRDANRPQERHHGRG
jgi:hypothetical protein